MLVIRMQRTGRSGHAQFRVIIQDSRRTPTSGKIVASLGSYNPHTKAASIDKDKAAFYLEHGAQPSERVARLLKAEGIKLPTWVQLSDQKKRGTRNPEKRRSTRPTEAEAVTKQAEEPAEKEEATEPAPDEPKVEETATEATEETVAQAPVETPGQPDEVEQPEQAETEESSEALSDAPAEPDTTTEATPEEAEKSEA